MIEHTETISNIVMRLDGDDNVSPNKKNKTPMAAPPSGKAIVRH